MSGTAGPPPEPEGEGGVRPDDAGGAPAPPPYPGPAQPGPGWGPPDQSSAQPDQGSAQPGQGWAQPGPSSAPPPYPGWSAEQPQAPGWGPPGGRPPGGPPGWGPPGGAQPPGNGWGAAPGPAWRIPDVKPGVIPLRPLGVGEILDGAVTTIRRNLGAMLGLSAVVAAITQVLSLAVLVWILGDQVTQPQPDFGASGSTEDVEDLLAGIPVLVASWFVTVLGTVFLTGVLTVVVGQAVLGRRLSIGEAWAESRGRLLRLLGLTLLYTLIWIGPLVAATLLVVLFAITGEPVLIGLSVIVAIALVLGSPWLYVRYALAGPALMLETTTSSYSGGSRPIRTSEAFRRSAALVRGSWWRVLGILLLIMIIVVLISQVVAVPFGIPLLFGDGVDSTFTWFVLNALAAIIAATITAPFSAAATALLYVDRRIRREGLDIDLARAAGVDLPGRGGPGAPPGTP